MLRFEERWILQLVWVNGAEIAEEDACSAVECVERASSGRRRGLMVYMGGVSSVSRGARTVFRTARSASAVALVGSPSPVDRILAAFIVGGNGESNSYCRFFTSASTAREWLKSSDAGLL